MRRFILILTVVWSVAGAPALCRAGMLVACCDHDAEPASVTAACTPDDCHCPNPDPQREPIERECGSCVFACGAVAKLTDELDTATDLQPISVSVDCEVLPVTDAGFAHKTELLNGSDPPGRPFPRSDIPLLI